MAWWNKKETTKAQIIPNTEKIPLFQPIDGFQVSGYNPTFGRKFNSEALLKLYNEVGDVYAIIDKISSKIAEPPIVHVKYLSNGKKKILGETAALKAVQQLNIKNVAASYLVQGNVPIWMLRTPGFGSIPTKNVQLPSQNVFPIPEKHVGLQGEPLSTADPRFNQVIYYNLNIGGNYYRIELQDLIYIKNANPNMTGIDYYSGMSPLYSATRSIDILSGLYDTINTVTSYRGALGFVKKRSIAGQPDPMAGATQGQAFIEEYFKKYGTRVVNGKRQNPIGFTPFDLQWVRMDAPIHDFLPVELTAQQFGRLCNQFGISDVLFNNNEASTESNVKAAEIRAYQDCYIPTSKIILDAISQGYGMAANNEYFELDLSGISCLQEDEKFKYEAKEAARTYLQGLYDSGYITRNQVLEGLGLPTVDNPEFDKLKEPQEDGNDSPNNTTGEETPAEDETETSTGNS